MTTETDVPAAEDVNTDVITETKPQDVTVEETPPTTRRKKLDVRDPDDAILALRKENENLRKKLEEAADSKAREMAEEQIKQAKKEATEAAEKKLEARLAEVDALTKARLVKSELKAAAIRAGVIDFGDLYAIMHGDLGKIEIDADGEVTNAHELIADIKAKKAHLFGGVSTSSTTTPPATTRQQEVEKAALTMTPAEYKKARAKLIMM